jgi:hypothetical protein
MDMYICLYFSYDVYDIDGLHAFFANVGLLRLSGALSVPRVPLAPMAPSIAMLHVTIEGKRGGGGGGGNIMTRCPIDEERG